MDNQKVWILYYNHGTSMDEGVTIYKSKETVMNRVRHQMYEVDTDYCDQTCVRAPDSYRLRDPDYDNGTHMIWKIVEVWDDDEQNPYWCHVEQVDKKYLQIILLDATTLQYEAEYVKEWIEELS